MKKLICYQVAEGVPRIVPADSERAWMNATRNRYAYRCLPLTIANSMGWEMHCPMPVRAEWNGGAELADLVVGGEAAKSGFAQSHFGHGILTLQTGYVFRTDPGIGLWARGVPNLPKDGIAPLDGIVETDWLTFTFTMNWMFTRPGRIAFAAGEPFCFVTPIPYRAIEKLVPEIVPLSAEPEMAANFKAYAQLRTDFNAKLAENDAATVRQGWQKWYMRGEMPDGAEGSRQHLSKLRLAEPRVAAAPKAVGRKRRPPTRRTRSLQN